MGFANRNSALRLSGIVAALAGLAAAHPAEPLDYETGPIWLAPLSSSGGSGPIHRRGRFKRNQRKQRRGRK